MRRAWSTALATLIWFAAPAFALLAVVGQDLVVGLLGAKWLAAGSILVFLALRGPAHVVERTLGWLHVVSGRPERWRHWGMLNCAVMVAALFCGLPFGAIGVAAAYAIATYLLFIPAVAYSGSSFGIRARDVMAAVGPQVLSALAATAAALVVLVFRVTKPMAVALSLLRKRREGAAGQAG